MSFDSVPTENSTNMVNSGVVYSALDLKADKSTTYTKTETDNLINTRLAELVASAPATLDTLQELATALGNDPNFATTIATQLGNKADKSDTYTKTEVDTALSNVQSTLTFDNVPTANSDNPVKSSGIKTALDGKQDTLTFDSTPTANSTNPVTSGGVYTALASKADSSSVPTKVSDLTNDSGFITGVAWNEVTSKPTFATVATSGSYTDLEDKPTIPPTYTLPTASANTLGGIKVGANLFIDNNGVLSVSGSGGNITVDSTITENSQNPVTSAAIYAALQNLPSGGGSGSGNAFTEDVLFSDSTGVNSGTINLSDSIADYDLIVVSIKKDSSTNANQYIYLSSFVQSMDGTSTDKIIISTRYDNQYISWYCPTNSTIGVQEYTGSVKIYKVTGIKFSGGGGGSGDSIIVDQGITTNSHNPVSSYGLYECFQDILNVEGTLVDDNLYYRNTADEVLLVRREVNVYKKYNTPAIGGIYRLNDAWGHAHYHLLLLSLSEDGADMYSNNGSDIDTGTYVDSVRNITWYYKSMSTNDWSGSGNTFYVPLINNGDATNSLTKSQIIALLLQEANPTISEISHVIVDSTPTENSTNPVTSGGIYNALRALEARIAALEGN